MPRIYKSPITSRIFNLVAAVLYEEYDIANRSNNFEAVATIERLANDFAGKFSESNPQFNHVRFFNAVRGRQ